MAVKLNGLRFSPTRIESLGLLKASAALGDGFYDQAHMTNAFRMRVGLRPSEFLAWFRAT